MRTIKIENLILAIVITLIISVNVGIQFGFAIMKGPRGPLLEHTQEVSESVGYVHGIKYLDGRPYLMETDTLFTGFRDQFIEYTYWTKYTEDGKITPWIEKKLFVEISPEEYQRCWWALEWEGYSSRLRSKEYIYTLDDGYVIRVVDGERVPN